MNFGSLYARLRLTAAATQSEIKGAYYRLCKIYHPDKANNSPKATTQFRNITEAYEVLSDPTSKAAYDKGNCICFFDDVLHFVEWNLMAFPFIIEYLPKIRFGGSAARFRASNRRRLYRSVDVQPASFVDDLNTKVDKRIKQYCIQIEKEAKQ